MHRTDLADPPEDVGTIDLTPRVPALDGRHLNWLIEQYLYRCRSEFTDPTTVDSYESNLLWFNNWWEREGPKQNWLLRQNDLLRFEKFLREAVSERTHRKLAFNTRKDVLRRMAEVFRWAQTKNYVSRDYTRWLPRPAGQTKKRKAAPLYILERLILDASSSYIAARDRAMLTVFIGMGLRRAEVSRLDVEDLTFKDDSSGYASITGKRTRDKGDGHRDAAFDKATGHILANYLEAVGYERGPLFRGRNNERLTVQGVYKVVKRLIVHAGLEEHLQGCHDLRRAFATHVARHRQGKDSAKLLKEQMGHTSYAHTADKYILTDVEDIRIDLVSPISLMSPNL